MPIPYRQGIGKNKGCDLMKRMSLPKTMGFGYTNYIVDHQIISLQTHWCKTSSYKGRASLVFSYLLLEEIPNLKFLEEEVHLCLKYPFSLLSGNKTLSVSRRHIAFLPDIRIPVL